MATRTDRDQTWRKLPDGSMELIEDVVVEREIDPPPVEERVARIEAIDSAKLQQAATAIRAASTVAQLRAACITLVDALTDWAGEVQRER